MHRTLYKLSTATETEPPSWGALYTAESGFDWDPGHLEAAPKWSPEYEEGNPLWHCLHGTSSLSWPNPTHLLTSLRKQCTAKHDIVYSLKLRFDLQIPVLIILCFQNLLLLQTLFYMAVACLSYSGFGDASPGNLLTGFGFFDPYCKPDIFPFPDNIISHPLKLLITLLDTRLYSAACKSFRHSHSWRSPYKCILQSMSDWSWLSHNAFEAWCCTFLWLRAQRGLQECKHIVLC